MKTQAKRKAGGGKLSRSQTVTVRLDAKLRYLAELAARSHRRTLSSFVEWAIEDSLKRVCLDNNVSIAQLAGELWDVDEPDRFVKLATHYPALLTHDEQVLWKLISENPYLRRGGSEEDILERDSWPDRIVVERIRKNWQRFKAVAAGEADANFLPK